MPNPGETQQQQNNDIGAAALVQLAEVKGQLSMIAQLIQTNHGATHQRIDDLRQTVENRFSGVETRLETIEQNERGTAIRAAGSGAFSGAIVAGAIEVMKHFGP